MNCQYLPLTLVLSFLSLNAAAADKPSFAERVAMAKELEHQGPTSEYLQSAMFPAIGPELQSSMVKCMSRSGASALKFSVVADVTPEGKFIHIAREPNTNTAACLANAMGKFRAPPPPMCDYGANLPIVIEMSIEP